MKSSELDDYFRDARTFDHQRVAGADRSRKVAWAIAAVATAVAVVAVGAVAGLTPLKTVEAFVVRVDNANGVVDVVAPLRGSQTYPEAVAKFWVKTYVTAREGYVNSEAQLNWHTVTLMSVDSEQQRYASGFSGKNPESPQVVYGAAATARIAIKSISMLSADVASVRYSRTVTRNESVTKTNWVATMTFRYATAPMSEGDRMVNPLGFQVADYRIDPESL